MNRLREVEAASVQQTAAINDLQTKLTIKEHGMATLSLQLAEAVNSTHILQTDLDDAKKQIDNYKRQAKPDLSSSPKRPCMERDLTPLLEVSPQL